MDAAHAIRAALNDPMTSLTGAMVAQGPDGAWDFFFHGTPPHHHEGERLVKWEVDETCALVIEPQVAAEALDMGDEDIEVLIEQLAMRVGE